MGRFVVGRVQYEFTGILRVLLVMQVRSTLPLEARIERGRSQLGMGFKRRVDVILVVDETYWLSPGGGGRPGRLRRAAHSRRHQISKMSTARRDLSSRLSETKLWNDWNDGEWIKKTGCIITSRSLENIPVRTMKKALGTDLPTRSRRH